MRRLFDINKKSPTSRKWEINFFRQKNASNAGFIKADRFH